MAATKLYPLITTSRLVETRQFYTQVLGFTVTFDLPTYLQLHHGARQGPEVCFMPPEASAATPHMSRAFAGAGLVLSIPVVDADAKYAAVRSAGAEATAPADRPWGWRSFYVADPNGVVLDFFHEIEPAPELKHLLQPS